MKTDRSPFGWPGDVSNVSANICCDWLLRSQAIVLRSLASRLCNDNEYTRSAAPSGRIVKR